MFVKVILIDSIGTKLRHYQPFLNKLEYLVREFVIIFLCQLFHDTRNHFLDFYGIPQLLRGTHQIAYGVLACIPDSFKVISSAHLILFYFNYILFLIQIIR